MEFKLTKNRLVYGNMAYFRRNAPFLGIGTVGDKQKALAKPAYVAPEDTIMPIILNDHVKRLHVADINWNSISEAALNAEMDAKFLSFGRKDALKLTIGAAKSGNVKLISFYIPEGPLKRMLNKQAGRARNYLAEEGKDGRVVSTVWIAAEGEITNKFSASGDFLEVRSAGDSSITLGLKGRIGKSEEITFGPDLTIAYGLHKVKKWNKGKTEIEDMEDDKPGMN